MQDDNREVLGGLLDFIAHQQVIINTAYQYEVPAKFLDYIRRAEKLALREPMQWNAESVEAQITQKWGILDLSPTPTISDPVTTSQSPSTLSS